MSTSSELLTPQTRQRIEAAFGVRPTDLYGTTEGIWGCECERRDGLHLFEDMCLVENVDADGSPVPAGEPGAKLLITNLYNHDQPLIRFELTDAVAFDPEPCPCGRSLRRLRAIEGRADDVIVLDGVAVHPMQFAVLTADRGVREFQVVQRASGWSCGWRSTAAPMMRRHGSVGSCSSVCARSASASRWSMWSWSTASSARWRASCSSWSPTPRPADDLARQAKRPWSSARLSASAS